MRRIWFPHSARPEEVVDRAQRVHYSIVAITLAGYPLQMVYLGFIL
ncbi:MAG: hypothetical protein OXC31_04270 [Spirochaetaceae bacterium]|nr:hypothetical protein [Spirochaetaceae bacterium]